MKDTINRLARGVFEYEPPVIEISEVNIEKSIGINSIYCGELRIKSVAGQTIKGIVSSSNHAVTMDKATFVGTDNAVTYKVDTRGILRGEKIQGSFNVISSGGEMTVTYTFTVADNTAKSSLGSIKNMFHFANLVQTEPEEAYKLFVSDEFEDIFLKDDYELKNRYRLLLYGEKPKYLGVRGNIKHCVEELLISIRKKTPVKLSVSEEHKEYKSVTEAVTDSVIILKNTWGAVNVGVSCDNPCIKPETDYIDEDKFAGSRYELRYFVDPKFLHDGRNYARITLKTLHQQIDISFLLIKEGNVSGGNQERLELQKNLAFLIESYISFRTKKINMAQWTKQSITAIEKIRAIDDENPFYRLIHAQLLTAVRKRDEAKWLIDSVRDYIGDSKEDKASLYSYYLYVNSLFKQDKTYAMDSLKTVKRLYGDGNDEWQVLWVMFYLDDEYEKNKSLKIARIKEQYAKGCVSPVMYLEAALAFAEQPLLLRVFDEFEIQTLIFACRRGIISERLLAHIVETADNRKTYSGLYQKLLKMMYDLSESRALLSIIYKNMIKNANMPKDCFVWIKRAVDADLRITNLYENYMAYCDKKNMSPLPKIILMYFAYNSSLDYRLKAYLFANVLYNRYDDPQTFETYRYQMERFVLDQVNKGHIDVNLSALYKQMLEPSMINEDTSKMLAKILFSYRVTCDNPVVTNVYVKHKETEEIQVSTFVNGEAYINLYTPGAGIVLGDAAGNRYMGSIGYKCEKVFDGDRFIPLAFKYLKNDLWMSLYFCENGKKYGYSEYDMVCCYKNIIHNKNITEYYRDEFTSRIIDYYYSEYDKDAFDEEYIDIDVDRLSESDRVKVTETYILNGKFREAMDIIRKRGAVSVNPKRLLRMCASLIDGAGGEKDDEVLSICEIVFKQHKYDEAVLKYLVKFYDCSTKDMISLWKAAKDFEIDTSELEERILYQMMFIRSYSPVMAKVFESYYNHGARQRVVEAYIAYNSYNFFVKNMVIDNDVFRVIEHFAGEDTQILDVCKLALLKYYADDIDIIELTKKQQEIAQKLLNEMVERNKIFEFYKKLNRVIAVPHEVLDKTMVEYRTNPDTRVYIHYVLGNDEGSNEYTIENMENVFEGIFVKKYVLFYGDKVQYYITENSGEDEKLTESGSVTNQNVKEDMSQGRYEMINDMLACLELNDSQTMKKMMNSYVMSDMLSKEIFKPL